MEPPIIPIFDIPTEAFIPIPAVELPAADQLEFEPIFVPQTVSPGSIQQLLIPPEEEESLDQEEEESEPSREERESEQEPPAVERNIDTLLREVQRYQIQSPKIDMLDGWPFEEEPIEPLEPIIPEVPKTKTVEGVVTVQVLGIALPMPAPEILVAAGATAGVSVAATLASTSILKKVTGIMKPIIKQIIARLQKKKIVKLTWARERLAQRRRKQSNMDSQV